MRKLGPLLLLAALTALVVIGCSDDEPDPSITRLNASEPCGVVPLRVDFRADATGGKPFADPTGGNNWLKMTWDFGDGTRIENGASIAYHEYEEPGTYTVTVTAEDDRGKTASRSLQIRANADSLSVTTYGLIDEMPIAAVEACRPVQLGVIAETCGFDPVTDSYERFLFRWNVRDSVYSGPHPQHSFTPGELGEQIITVRLIDPAQGITRRDTLHLTVLESPGADLSLSADWLLSDPASATPDLNVVNPVWPDTLTYTVHLRNDGPTAAYNLRVTSTLPPFNRLYFYRAVPSHGTATFTSSTRAVTWRVPELAADTDAQIDISFFIEVEQTTQYQFPSVLQPYPCDPDSDDVQVTPRLLIGTFR
jgi:uncharacterized repeat protein (TIGR01451 family)